MKLREFGEKRFINEYIMDKIVNKKYFLDAQLVEENLVVKVDGFPTKYILPFMDYFDLGWKAVVSTLSDMFSLGVRANFGLLSVGVDPDIEVEDLKLLFEGVSNACKSYNVELVGGDTNSGDWIDFFAIGKALCKNLFNPKPREGDYVLLTNPIGYTSLVFYEFATGKSLNLPIKYYTKVKHPILNVGILDIIRNNCNYINYSTDISDGILVTLSSFHNLTGLGVEIENLGFSEEVLEIANSLSIPIEELVKFSGEEFESILVVSESEKRNIVKELEAVGFDPIIIGRVTREWNVQVHGWDNYKGWF
ncbi:MAG: AIR synthase related protein [Sulfolobaceae archaeon]